MNIFPRKPIHCGCGGAMFQDWKRLPAGTNSCDCCWAISHLYELFPSCRECGDQFCSACAVAGSERDEDGHASVVCKKCAQPEAVSA